MPFGRDLAPSMLYRHPGHTSAEVSQEAEYGRRQSGALRSGWAN